MTWVIIQLVVLAITFYLIVRKIFIIAIDRMCQQHDAKLILARGSIPERQK